MYRKTKVALINKSIFFFLFFLLMINLSSLAQVPVISSFMPESAAAGTTVNISGSNFSNIAANNIVYFGAAKANVINASANSLSVIVPAGATYLPITVNVNNLTGFSSKSFLLSSISGPIVSESFNPAFSNKSTALKYVCQDFDGDGKPDVAFAAYSGISIMRNTSNYVGQISFSASQIVSNNNYTYWPPSLGDFDGDGKIDIASIFRIDIFTYKLSILKNTSTLGNISFTETNLSIIDLGKILISDFNLDGKSDIFFTRNGAGSQSYIYRNTSSGNSITFAAPQLVSTPAAGEYSDNIASSDLDGDGKFDLLLSNSSANTISLLRNTCSGGVISFGPKILLSVPGFPREIYTCDINMDGKQEIIVRARINGKSASILRNESVIGSFSFPSRTDFGDINLANGQLGFSDLNGDNKPEIIMAGGGSSNIISIFKNISSSGLILLDEKVNIRSESNFQDVVICDLDGDGKSDIEGTNYDNAFDVLRNSVAEPIINSFSPLEASLGDVITIKGISFSGTTNVNFSGIAATNFTIVSDSLITATCPITLVGNVSVKNLQGTDSINLFPIPKISSIYPAFGAAGSTLTIRGENFSPYPNENIVYFGSVKAVINSSTDSLLTVIIPKGTIPARISLTTHSLTAFSQTIFTLTFTGGDTTFNVSSFEKRDFMMGPTPSPNNLIINDLNIDGMPDIFVADNNKSFYLINTGDTASLAFRSIIGNYEQNKIILADLDSDGKFDKCSRNSSMPYGLDVNKNLSVPANLSFGKNISMFYQGPYQQSFVSGFTEATDDMNADGKTDIISFMTSGNSSLISIIENKLRNKIMSFNPTYQNSIGYKLGKTKAIDIDGDSISDVISLSLSPSNVFLVFKNNGINGNLSLASPIVIDGEANIISFDIGDINGDGKNDIVTSNNSTNNFSIFLNTSTANNISFAPRINYNTGQSPYSISVGDLNGDSKIDVAVTNLTNKTISIYLNTSNPGSISFKNPASYPTGIEPLFSVIGDVDADGVSDFVTVNSGSATVSVFRNKQGMPIEKSLCNPIGSTTINAGYASTSYQWQLSLDSINFFNITDNSNYSGSTTNTLNLNNIPSNWYGYQYRCISNGIPGRVSIIKFVNTWTGAIDSDWATPGNWSCGTVPDGNTDAFINFGNVVLNANNSVRSLTIKTPGTITVNSGATLTILH